MFRFWNSVKKHRFEDELKVIDEEINRSQRFDLNFSLLAVEVSHSAPRGLSKVLPGNVVSFHLLRKFIRSYDHMFGPYRRRYHIIFAQTDKKEAEAVKKRIYKLAEEYNWGNLSIGMAVYPEDGKTSQALLDKAINGLS